MRILIAEDDKISSLVLRKSLEALGHEVVTTVNGDEAWERLEDRSIRLVISDWMMPKTDGLELCRRIRARANPPYVYFMLLTAKDIKEDRLRALSLGADDFLVKPLDRAELMARLTVAQRLLAMEEQLRTRTLDLERMQHELEARNVALEELATSDSLTGLKNRRYFLDQIDRTFSFANRQHMPISVVMLDVDHFKSYNDQFGHGAGDEVLVDFGRVLQESVRDHDVVARYGGEEFIILLPATDPITSRVVGERIREAILTRSWPRRAITASIGISTIHSGVVRPSELIDRADKALYRAKSEGRNRVVHDCDFRPVENLDPTETVFAESAPNA